MAAEALDQNRARNQRQSAQRLERVAFVRSIRGDFCERDNLVAQIGHGVPQWPLVIAKELIDNSLDSCEQTNPPIAPVITIDVSTERGEIVVTDNGPGIPGTTIDGIIDYNSRVSSKEVYVSPSRGRQGNALKVIIPMPLAMGADRGITTIEAHGKSHRIIFERDPIRADARILREEAESDVKNGTRITVGLPVNACLTTNEAEQRFFQLVGEFRSFNPHLTIRGTWDCAEFLDEPATDPAWRKWRMDAPTSAHWYGIEDFERYIRAVLAKEQDEGAARRLVRDFIKEELRGLSSSAKQKLVLKEVDARNLTLSDLFGRGCGAISQLLRSCQSCTAPVKPEALGLIGSDHLLEECCARGADEESFVYKRQLGTTANPELPFAIEVAFAYCPEGYRREIVSGINFSVSIDNPFSRIGWGGLGGFLGEQHVNYGDPVVLIVHYTSPGVKFTDRGKSSFKLPEEADVALLEAIEAVTAKWKKQKIREIRNANAAERRQEMMRRERDRPEKPERVYPSGVLAAHICAAADDLRVKSIDAWTVISPANDPYTAWRKRRQAEWFAALFNRFVPPEAKPRHLRGLFYRITSTAGRIIKWNGKVLVNDKSNWGAFVRASKAVRWLGLVPFDRIIDARNAPPELYLPPPMPISTSIDTGTECDIPETLEEALPKFSLEGFKGRQLYRLIFYGEKSSLSEVLRPIAIDIEGEMILATGESSDTLIAGMAQRIADDGRPAVVFYFSDFDPTGHQMPVNVGRKLQALRDLYYPNIDVKLYPVALTFEQVKALDLPSKPLTAKEKRSEKWKAAYGGHEQTEIDAMIELYPDVLRTAVYDAIKPFYDAGLKKRITLAKDEWQREADKILQEHPDYQDTTERIGEAWEAVNAAVGELHTAQQEAAEILEESVPPAPELPEAKPEGIAPPALFDTAYDFKRATLLLKRHKELTAAEEEDAEEDEDAKDDDDE